MADDTAAPVRNFTLSVGDRLSALAQGPPAYMRRRRRIEDLEERLVRLLAAGVDPASPDVVRGLATLGDLIDKHNRYYPIEANLPVDPRSRTLLDRGAPWRPVSPVTLEDLLARALPGEEGAARAFPLMHIEHVAIWTADLERLRAFYERHLGAVAGPKYVNAAKGFESYFLRFDSSSARLEIMTKPAVVPRGEPAPPSGYAHIAISVGARARVDELTERLSAAGYTVLDGPRTTGDGYYESVVLDPDGNQLELTV